MDEIGGRKFRLGKFRLGKFRLGKFRLGKRLRACELGRVGYSVLFSRPKLVSRNLSQSSWECMLIFVVGLQNRTIFAVR